MVGRGSGIHSGREGLCLGPMGKLGEHSKTTFGAVILFLIDLVAS